MILLNGKQINVTRFPDRTSQVWQIDNYKKGEHNTVWWYFEQEVELFWLFQLNEILRLHPYTGTTFDLYIPYVPYARQDKVCSNEATFALRCFIDIMHLMFWHQIYVFDVHSDVWPMRDSRVKNILPDFTELQKQYDTICFPDAGAATRYQHLFTDKNVIYGKKVREQKSGWIIGYDINGQYLYHDSILVVDDLCDGGATFNLLADNLGVTKAPDLYVSHGLFSKGVKSLFKKYGKIYTTNSCFKTVDMRVAAHQNPLWQQRLEGATAGRFIIQDVEEILKCTT